MTDRLMNGQNELVLPVIREATTPNGNYNVEVADLIKVRVSAFTLVDNKADTMTFTIIQGSVPAMGFASNPQNLGISSLSTVQLAE